MSTDPNEGTSSTGGKVALIVAGSVVVAVAAFAVSSAVGGSDDDGSTAPQPSISPSVDPSSHSPSPTATAGPSTVQRRPITAGGNGTGNSYPFRLRGGDYRVDWTTRGDCSYSVEMVPAIGSYGAQDLITTEKATSGGQILTDVNAGPYLAEGVTDPAHGCGWKVTITQVKPG